MSDSEFLDQLGVAARDWVLMSRRIEGSPVISNYEVKC